MIPLKDTIPSRTFPFINYLIIFINLFCFLYEVSLGRYLQDFIFSWGLVPVRFFSPLTLELSSIIERLLPFFSSMFLHGGWIHFLGNMLYLYIFGDNVEDRLGHFRYLLFYLLCGIAASVAQLSSNPQASVPMVGASGAIAGVMGAYFLLYPYSRVVTLLFLFFFIEIVEIPAFFFLAFWFLLQFFSGALSLSSQSSISGGVAWWAHIGGFLSGVVLLFLFKKKRTKRRR
jgi:membrane associated rhomboid family serine protease